MTMTTEIKDPWDCFQKIESDREKRNQNPFIVNGITVWRCEYCNQHHGSEGSYKQDVKRHEYYHNYGDRMF